MTQLLIYFFIGISLSMDAFSVAISIGIANNKKEIVPLVGLFHFIMTILGGKIGLLLSNTISTKTNYISAIVFFLLGIEMITTKNKENDIKIDSIIANILLALAVSIDSFSVGIVLGIEKSNLLLASITFSLISMIFTYLGLLLGKNLKNTYQNNALNIGIIIIIIIAIKALIFG